MERTRCITCGSYIEVGRGATEFACPDCGKTIGRCSRCRSQGVTYRCECGFLGP
ncbi:MAG: DUF1610 domain-containing protein [Euryarchaeota archaeon]|nr:DUF1610 domain-containing protein [Euryarchaeota archaeon]